MNWKEFLTGYRGKKIPDELKEFNWGAFLLTFIWGIKHKAWITLLAIPLIWFQMPLGINWLLYTILQFYCGFKGNMWAYQVDWWMSHKDFRMYQMRWAAAAILLNIFIPVFLLGVAIQFVKKSPDNPAEFIKNSQCTVAYSKIKKGFKNVSLNSTSTPNSVSKDFARQFKNASSDNEQARFSVKAEGKNVETYYISFALEPEKELCNILQQNCSIQSSFILPPEMSFSSHCTFYFDMHKNFEPDEQTRKALDKGFNIFKYL